jgi:small subunit ribosomal protein S4
MARQELQCKKCRRAGEKLFLKGDRCNSQKCPIITRNFPPGMHGNKGPKRLTNYGSQLAEKQKAKRTYGLMEKQFRAYFDKALKRTGNTGEILFALLENRLDNTIYRMGLASSRAKARQLITHGHFTIKGKKLDIPSYQVKIGDVVGIKEKSKKSPAFLDIAKTLENKKDTIVSWVNMDIKTLEGKVTSQPVLKDVEMNIKWQMIVEFYSK